MPASQQTPALSLEGLSKVFQGQPALDDVDLELRAGEIHALLGQNGCGKSTLIKILAGYHQPEPGASAYVHGQELELGSPVGAREASLRFIHQDLGLVDDFDAVDNLALGGHYRGSWWLSDRRERKVTQQRLDAYGIEIDVAAPMHRLSAAQRSMLAIVRALDSGMADDGLLVLDEPTAALPDQEVRQLFGLVRQIRDRGGTVLYVTHRLDEVFQICDRVTVLRDGRKIATRQTAELNHDSLVELIIGRPLDAFYPELPPPREDVVLAVDSLSGGAVDEVSLRVHAGEIVGVTGLVGSGSEALLKLIFGGETPSAGTVAVDGNAMPLGSPSGAVAAGLAYTSGDRKRLGGMLDWTLRENLTLPRVNGVGPLRWLGKRTEQGEARPWLQRLGVVPADTERPFAALSGGNQQKVVLARWLRCGARAYLLEEPTNGIDMGAKHAIYESLTAVAAEGAAILLSSTDAEELCAVCDRVIVMRAGRVGSTLVRSQLSVDAVIGESLRGASENGHNPTIQELPR
jgi:ribose transport system ATP-binding protein